MATTTGRIVPELHFDFETDPATILTTTDTNYAWETSVGDKITLVGSFAYPSGTSNRPTGQVAQILIDVGNDGTTDLTITYSALKSILADLINGDEDVFWAAALSEAGDGRVGIIDGFALDGGDYVGGVPQIDTATINGVGNVAGDYLFAHDGLRLCRFREGSGDIVQLADFDAGDLVL